MTETIEQTGTVTTTDTDTETQGKSGYYPKWVVIFHNDDGTAYDFVVGVLVKFFNKAMKDAQQLAEEVHKNGQGVAGIFPKEQAEFRSHETMKLAREHGYPLQLSVEPE
tara:strand:- start:81682 stop:82008 length:327 start_codon:yes stop_codon:yes gene_type:complete